ncbi:MAG: hypothetical protein KGZ60_11235 [Truepera sp.]|nr:hypothetical protein [Truepera sp.]
MSARYWPKWRGVGLALLLLSTLEACLPGIEEAGLRERALAPAFRDLYFGYSMQQVDYVSQRDPAIRCWLCLVQANSTLAGVEVTLTLRYLDDRLYRVYLSTAAFSADQLRARLLPTVEQLLTGLRAERGPPDWQDRLEPANLAPGRIGLLYGWETDSNGVRTWLGLGRYEHEHYAVVIIEYAPLVEASGSARLVP